MPDFTGKVAMITGADGGIGRVLCRHLAGRGAAIAAVDKRASVTDFVAELAADGVPARAAVVDVTDADGVRAAIGEIEAALGPVDVLVNNAGFAERESLEKTTAETWRIDIEGNLNGAYHCTAAVLPQMAAHHAGAIVNISSVNGLTSLGHPAYSAAKAGLISYTKAVAMEYGRLGIRANAICPGTVRTPIWASRVARRPEVFERLVKWYPLGRIAEPKDIAKAVAFLASDDAAAITGAVLNVDCGLTAGNIVMTRELTLEPY